MFYLFIFFIMVCRQVQQQRLGRWAEAAERTLGQYPAAHDAAVGAVDESPYDRFALALPPQSAQSIHFTYNNKVCPHCGHRRPLYCWDCFEPVIVMKIKPADSGTKLHKGRGRSARQKNTAGKHAQKNSTKKRKIRRIRPEERLTVLREALQGTLSHCDNAANESQRAAPPDGQQLDKVESDSTEEAAPSGHHTKSNDGVIAQEQRARELRVQAQRAEILLKWGHEDFKPHSLKLPLRLEILIQPALKLKRCTSIVAAVLSSPEFVHIHRTLASHSRPFRKKYSPSAYTESATSNSQPRPYFSPYLPDLDPDSTVVLYPSTDAVSVEEVAHLDASALPCFDR